MVEAFIAIGSNLGDREDNVKNGTPTSQEENEIAESLINV